MALQSKEYGGSVYLILVAMLAIIVALEYLKITDFGWVAILGIVFLGYSFFLLIEDRISFLF